QRHLPAVAAKVAGAKRENDRGPVVEWKYQQEPGCASNLRRIEVGGPFAARAGSQQTMRLRPRKGSGNSGSKPAEGLCKSQREYCRAPAGVIPAGTALFPRDTAVHGAGSCARYGTRAICRQLPFGGGYEPDVAARTTSLAMNA